MFFSNKNLIALASVAAIMLSYSGNACATQQDDYSMSKLETEIANRNISQGTFDALEEMIKREPDNAYAHLLLAEAWGKKGYQGFAQDHLDLSRKARSKPEQAVRYLRLKIFRGDIADAMLFAKNLRQGPIGNSPEVRLLDGLAYQMKDQTTEAERIFSNLLKLPDPPIGAATALASIRLKEKNYKEAIHYADIDLWKRPDYSAGNLVKGEALIELGNFHDAITPLRRAFQEHPTNPFIAWPFSRCLMKEGRYREALAPTLYAMASGRNPRETYAAINAAKVLIKTCPPAYVKETVDKVAKIIDDSALATNFHCALGIAFERAHKPDKAMLQYVDALRFTDTYVPAMYRLGRCMERQMNDYVSALDEYRRSYYLDPEYDLNRDAMDRLASRVANHDNDLAWRLKEMITGKAARRPVLPGLSPPQDLRK